MVDLPPARARRRRMPNEGYMISADGWARPTGLFEVREGRLRGDAGNDRVPVRDHPLFDIPFQKGKDFFEHVAHCPDLA